MKHSGMELCWIELDEGKGMGGIGWNGMRLNRMVNKGIGLFGKGYDYEGKDWRRM